MELIGSFWYPEDDPKATEYFRATVIRFVTSSQMWMVEFVNLDGLVEQCLVPFDLNKWRWPVEANQG